MHYLFHRPAGQAAGGHSEAHPGMGKAGQNPVPAPALRPPAVPRGGGPPHTGRDPARRPAGGGVRPGVHKKQADAGDLERQKERLLACAALKGYRVVHVFWRRTVGSEPEAARCGRLRTALERCEVDRVLVEYPDRLARFRFE